MMDYNIGEKYQNKFVSVDNKPMLQLYDFDEFSYFGKDSVWEPKEQDLQDWMDELREWVQKLDTSKSKVDQTPIQLFTDIYQSDDAIPSTKKQETKQETKQEVKSGNSTTQRIIGDFNVEAAIDRLHYLTQFKLNSRYDTSKWTKKNPYSSGSKCGRAVTLALEAGGLNTQGRENYAGNQGKYLLKSGWQQLPDDVTDFKAGDICVIKGLGSKDKDGNRIGHMAMFDGQQWVSDFYQKDWDVYHGQAKRGVNTHFYRYRG